MTNHHDLGGREVIFQRGGKRAMRVRGGETLPAGGKSAGDWEWKRIVTFFVLLGLGLSLGGAVTADDGLRAGDQTSGAESMNASVNSDGVLVKQGETPVLFFQRATKSVDGKWPRAGYVHPLYDLKGNVITEDFPEDHRHHRGVFWAWHQVWIGQQRVGDPWVCKDFQWDVQQVETVPSDDAVTLTASVIWKSPSYVDDSGAMLPIARETTKITARIASEKCRTVDFEIAVLALVDHLRIGGSDDVKGYGGFSPRIKLTSDTRFRSAHGEVEPIKTAIDAGNWIDISDHRYGITILSHPSNPVPTGRWILRRKNSMQNAVYPGRDPVFVSSTEPVVLRYRLVIHHGDLPDDQIEAFRQNFAR